MPRLTDKLQAALKVHAPHIFRSLDKKYGPVVRGAPEVVAEIRRDRKAVHQEMRNMHESAEAENRSFTQGEKDAWDALTAIVDNLDSEIEQRSSSGRLTSDGGEPSEDIATNVYAKDQRMSANCEGRDTDLGAIMRALICGAKNDAEERALGEGTSSQGGYTVPIMLQKELIDRVRNRAAVFKAGANTVLMDSEKTSIARLDTDPVATWRLENADVTEGDPTFGNVTLQARSLAVLVRVSRELLEDSLNVESALNNALQQALALELDRVAMFGTGTAPEPRGVFNTAGIQSYSMGVNGAVIANYAPLIQASLLLATQNATPSAMIMSARTQHTLGGLVDTTNQPLNMPQILSVYPQLVTNSVPVNQTQGTSTDCSTILLGDFRQLYIGLRQGIRIEVLRERYVDKLQYGFVAHLRADVAVAQPSNFCKLIGIKP